MLYSAQNGLYFLPGSNFSPLEDVKVPVFNSAEFLIWKINEKGNVSKRCTGGFWRIQEGS